MKRDNYLKDAKIKLKEDKVVLRNVFNMSKKKIGNSVDKIKLRWEKGSPDLNKYIKESL